MDGNWLGVIGTVIVAIIAAIPGVLALRGQFRKTRTESDSNVVDDAMKLVEQYRIENAAMRAEIADLRARVVELELHVKTAQIYRSGAIMLAHQIRALGHEPVFDPTKGRAE